MNCKYCNAELVEGQPFCPGCGKKQDEEIVVAETPETVAEQPAAEEKKATPGKIALAVVACLAVLALLIAMIINGKTDLNKPVEEPTEPVVEVTIPSNGDPESVLCKPSYTVSDEEAQKTADVVVATVGDKTLTNGQLQAFYWQEVYLFLQEYGAYLPYIGLDTAKPLDQQLTEMGETPMSWQQFFLDSAIYSWHNYQSMELEGENTDYQLPADRQAQLDSLRDDLEAASVQGGFESIDAMIHNSVGAACNLENYLAYVDVYYHGLGYYYDYCENLNPSNEEVEAYYAENEASYIQNGVTKDAKFVDVRHVLVLPEGGEAGADGYMVYTDEAWEACRVKAEELYNQWQTGDMSEESFALLANENTADGNDANGDGEPDGGLYENVYVGQMVTEFEDWCFDETRQSGDHGLVKTRYGYHIMFFCDSRPIQYATARDVLLQPENGEIGEDGYMVYTEEAWEACRVKAEELYNQWLAGDMTEESFAQMALEHSAGSNAAEGGLNQSFYIGQMEEEFDDWCFAKERVAGDHGLIKTPSGYRIVFMSALNPAWFENAKYDLVNDIAYDFIPAMMEKHPMTIDFSLVALGNLDLS